MDGERVENCHKYSVTQLQERSEETVSSRLRQREPVSSAVCVRVWRTRERKGEREGKGEGERECVTVIDGQLMEMEITWKCDPGGNR